MYNSILYFIQNRGILNLVCELESQEMMRRNVSLHSYCERASNILNREKYIFILINLQYIIVINDVVFLVILKFPLNFLVFFGVVH